MKALVYYGPEDLRLTEIADAKPAAGEVLVRVRACGICGSDVHGYLGITGRRIAPMVMGHEFAGAVAEVGDGVDGLAVGERVTVQPVNFCGECDFCRQGLTNLCTHKRFLGVLDVDGALAEYVCVPAKLIYKLPPNVDYIGGAMVEPLAVAYRAVRMAPPLAGKTVLIVGAGTIGLLILQVVKEQKPARIIMTDLSDSRLAVARTIGADIVVNPAREDVGAVIGSLTDGRGADAALEAVGATPTVQQAMAALRIGGTCVWVGNSAKTITINMQEVVTRELKVTGTFIYTHAEFGEALELLARGGINLQPLISRTAPLAEGPAMFAKLAKAADDLIKVVVAD